jgi:hypothetical protein
MEGSYHASIARSVTKADQAARALVALLPFWGRAFQLVSAHSTDSLDFNLQAPGPSERPLNVIRRDRLTRIVDGLSTESRKIAARTMPSNHANAGLLIRRGLYDNLHSFAELEQRISALGDENSKAVGDAFEVFVEGYLATHQKLQAEAVWLVGQVPPPANEPAKRRQGHRRYISDADGRTRSLSGQVQITARLSHLHTDSAVLGAH